MRQNVLFEVKGREEAFAALAAHERPGEVGVFVAPLNVASQSSRRRGSERALVASERFLSGVLALVFHQVVLCGKNGTTKLASFLQKKNHYEVVVFSCSCKVYLLFLGGVI